MASTIEKHLIALSFLDEFFSIKKTSPSPPRPSNCLISLYPFSCIVEAIEKHETRRAKNCQIYACSVAIVF